MTFQVNSSNTQAGRTFNWNKAGTGYGNGTNLMSLDADSGNLGVGISPSSRLHVYKENTVSRTSVQDLIYLGTTHASVGYDGFGTGIVDFRRTYQNSTPHAINRISFIERGSSVSDYGGAITFETKALSSGSVAPVERVRIDYNGNVGVGTNSPTRNLDVNGDLRIMKGSNPINFTSSWSSTPDSVTNTSEISNDVSGYQTLMIIGNKSAGSGRRVGIWDYLTIAGGTVAQPLNVNGKAYFANSVVVGTTDVTASDTMLEVYKAGTASWNPRIVARDGSVAAFMGVYNAKPGLFGHNNALNAWNTIYINTVTGVYNDGNGTNVIMSGPVGIGTSSPQTMLNVNLGAGDATYGTPAIRIGGTSNYDSLTMGIKGAYDAFIATYGNDLHIYSGNWKSTATASENHNIYFYTSQNASTNWNTAKMMLRYDGNVGINTTSPSFKLNVIDVGANISSGNAISTSTMKGIMVENSNNNNESIGIWFRTGSNHLSGISAQRNDYTSTWGTDLRFYTHENNTVDLTYARQRMIITSEGAMGLGLTPTNTGGRFEASNDIVAYSSSDIRFKDNVSEIDNPIEKILRIRGVYFDWIEMEKFHGNKGHDIGVIAQEVEEILPEIVTTRENGYKAVKYERLIPLLIESIKELNQKIEDQQTLINSLLNKQD